VLNLVQTNVINAILDFTSWLRRKMIRLHVWMPNAESTSAIHVNQMGLFTANLVTKVSPYLRLVTARVISVWIHSALNA
jgi:hypothetical protein